MIVYDKLAKSLKNLALQLDNYQRLGERESLSALDEEAIAESVIQRFEISYDVLWKQLKRYLVWELGLPEVPNSPKPVFRLAAENKLLNSPIDQWLRYADARVGTSHDYSGVKAEACLNLAQAFLDDAGILYQRLAGEPWK